MWYYNTTYLSHHGILGQKWGIRRFQNEDGSLTKAGEKRYGVSDEHKKEYKDAKKDAAKKYKIMKEAVKNNSRSADKKIEDVRNAIAKKSLIKTRNDIEKQNKKSKRQLKLEEEYVNSGMSKEDAEIAAYKRQKTEKILIGLAAASVATLGAMAAYKYGKENVDKVIKAGTEFQNISTNGQKGVKDAFYYSYKKTDNLKYRGMFGSTLMNNNPNSNVYLTTIKANKDIKVASPKSARKALEEVIQNKEFKDTLKRNIEANYKYGGGTEQQRNMLKKAYDSMSKGKIDKDVYEAYNYLLVGHSPDLQKMHNSFYDTLRKKGYDTLMDVNDKKYSGYNSISPMISFAKEGSLYVSDRRSLHVDELIKDKNKAYNLLLGEEFIKTTVPLYAAGGAAFVMGKKAIESTAAKNQSKIVVDRYKKEHPDTKLSDNEILKNYYNISD